MSTVALLCDGCDTPIEEEDFRHYYPEWPDCSWALVTRCRYCTDLLALRGRKRRRWRRRQKSIT